METLDDLGGAVAVVTAGGNGIGRSIVLAMAQAGADVVVADIVEQSAHAVAKEARDMGRQAIAVRTDVANREDMKILADAAFNEFGKVHILCNNAGVAIRPMRAIWDVSYEDVQWMINVNLWGMLNAIDAFLPRMRALSGRKHIVNTASMAAFTPVLGNAIYGLTKAGIDGYSDVIREELAFENIGVTTLYPGLVLTDAPENTRRLRNSEQQRADSAALSFQDYVAKKHVASDTDFAASRGGYGVIGAGQTLRAIDPAWVGIAVVDAIKNNRAYCLTHPAPADAIRRKAEAIANAYKPIPAAEGFFDP